MLIVIVMMKINKCYMQFIDSLSPTTAQAAVIKASLPVLPVVALGDPALMATCVLTQFKEVWPPIQAKPLPLCPRLSLNLLGNVCMCVCVCKEWLMATFNLTSLTMLLYPSLLHHRQTRGRGIGNIQYSLKFSRLKLFTNFTGLSVAANFFPREISSS